MKPPVTEHRPELCEYSWIGGTYRPGPSGFELEYR
jgi:hypothetical protein